MNKWALSLVVVLFFSASLFPQDEIDISSQEAYQMLKDPSSYLIDVRSVAEYVFVGHPEMAYNIPLLFWDEAGQEMEKNDNFLEDIKAKFKQEDTLLLICRTGRRSLRALVLLKGQGFKKVFNLKHGFEGDKDPEGYRRMNGWKNSGLPYTYNLEEELVYPRR